jgi:glutamate racemase
VSAGAPVGIFDSGLGGLSVAREIRAQLPAERLLYAADSAYCPYGGRPLEQIRERSLLVGRRLRARGAKAIVVACNTASGAALEALRGDLDIPVVGLEPAVKPAAELTRRGRIGVLATAATLKTERFDRLQDNFARDVEVHAVACPGLVELVEAGETSGERVHATLVDLLRPLAEAEVDQVVLGCTHYPFLREAISAVLGPEVGILDSGSAVARQLRRVLQERAELADSGEGSIRVLTTGDPAAISAVVRRLWGEPLPVERLDAEDRAA